TCGNANGSIDITVTGGTTPYTYSWSNISTTEDISNVAANTYTITVTDNNGCVATQAVTISTTTNPTLSTSITQTSCGNNNGAIDLTVTSGTSPYSYGWSNASTTEDISNLAANTYTVTVTDNNNCTA